MLVSVRASFDFLLPMFHATSFGSETESEESERARERERLRGKGGGEEGLQISEAKLSPSVRPARSTFHTPAGFVVPEFGLGRETVHTIRGYHVNFVVAGLETVLELRRARRSVWRAGRLRAAALARTAAARRGRGT